ncbi:hypothetical protein [Pseudomonas sp. PLMAX]|uniref:hypothetical protein n=1 Tax=Pseudomonas sp. PLMAX TaxID=2201998 RepID=UPI0038BD28E0
MKFTPEEFRNYFESAGRTILQPDMEKLKSNEFSEVCLDLVLAARELKVLEVLSTEVPTSVQLFAERIVEPYYCALGVVAASPFLPEREYHAALEEIGDLVDHPRLFGYVSATQKGFQVKADALGLNAHSLKINAYEPFTKSSAGYVLASRYATFEDVRYAANNAEHAQEHVANLSVFMEKLEKTRVKSPDWDDHAAFFKYVFSSIADHSPLGRKDPSIAKILRLVNDGAPLVSVDECVTATEEIFNGLLHDERSSPEDFQKNLDRLDDHDSFYEIAFQSKFLDMNRGASFFDRGFHYHSPEGRVNFGRNLQTLAQRLEGRVADPKIVLSGFLLGTSAIDALILKDRAQGYPQWLEHAILDKARDPRMLQQPDSSLSVVLNSLLSGASEPEKKAFWDARPERGLIRQSYESSGLDR